VCVAVCFHTDDDSVDDESSQQQRGINMMADAFISAVTPELDDLSTKLDDL